MEKIKEHITPIHSAGPQTLRVSNPSFEHLPLQAILENCDEVFRP